MEGVSVFLSDTDCTGDTDCANAVPGQTSFDSDGTPDSTYPNRIVFESSSNTQTRTVIIKKSGISMVMKEVQVIGKP